MSAYCSENEEYEYYKYIKLEPGEYKVYSMTWISRGDVVKAEINVVSGSFIDVYLLMGY